jgi:hypothetical protein
MYGSYFRPNTLFGLAHLYDQETLQGFVDTAVANQMGVASHVPTSRSLFGPRAAHQHLGQRPQPRLAVGTALVNLDLSLLLGYQLYRNWRGPLRLLTVCREPSEMENGRHFLNQLIDDARLPNHTQCHVYQGTLLERVAEAPQADLNIFGLARAGRQTISWKRWCAAVAAPVSSCAIPAVKVRWRKTNLALIL